MEVPGPNLFPVRDAERLFFKWLDHCVTSQLFQVNWRARAEPWEQVTLVTSVRTAATASSRCCQCLTAS